MKLTATSQQIASTILEAVKNGTAPWQKPWTPEQCITPYNPVSGTVYKGVNLAYLSIVQSMENRSDPRWMTYKQAQDKGWQVRRGEKSRGIQFWMFDREKVNPQTGEKERVRLERPMLRTYVVFNATQIEGVPALERAPVEEWQRHERAENILLRSGAIINHVQGDKAFYIPALDSITLPERRQFEAADKYYATALHELGHWTGHESRLDRDLKHPFGSREYATEELIAEIASWRVGMELGIGHDPEQHAAYNVHWAQILEDKPTAIFKACADAEKVSEFLFSIEKELTKDKTMEQDTIIVAADPQRDKEQEKPDQDHALAQPGQVQEKGQVFLSFCCAKDDSDNTFELLDAKGKADGVLRLNCAIMQDVEDKSPTAEHLNDEAVDGIVLLRDGRPVEAIVLNSPQLHKSMWAAGKDLAKHYLNVPFNEKDQASERGASWDGKAKSWYIPTGLSPEPFTQWLPEHARAQTVDNPQVQFAEFIQEVGGDLRGTTPEMDGKIHRIPEIGGKSGNKNIAYVGYLDGHPAGWVKNFRGEEHRWSMAGVVLTQEDRELLQKEQAEKKEQRKQERQEQYEQKAKESQEFVHGLKQATGEEKYYQEKGIAPSSTEGVMVDNSGNIIVPLVDIDGQQWSHVTLQANGFKQNLKDARMQGTFHVIGATTHDAISGAVILVEGYSTGAAINEVTGMPVVVCTSANNLENVAVAMRDRHPNQPILILGDNDEYLIAEGKQNQGKVKALAAAAAVEGHTLFPSFGDQAPDKSRTDFLDMKRDVGVERMRDSITAKIATIEAGAALEEREHEKEEQECSREEAAEEMER